MDMMTKVMLFVAVVIMDVIGGLIATRVLTNQGKQEQIKIVLIALASSVIMVAIVLFAVVP